MKPSNLLWRRSSSKRSEPIVSVEELRELWLVLRREYLERTAPLALQHFKTTERDSAVKCEATLKVDGTTHHLTGDGNGPIEVGDDGGPARAGVGDQGEICEERQRGASHAATAHRQRRRS